MANALTAKPGGGGESFFSKKMGPLPMWGWIAVAVVGFYVYRKFVNPSSSSQTSQAATTIPTAAQETLSGPGGYYTGPWGGAPPGIVTPPASTTPTPGGTGTPAPGGGSGTSPNTPPASGASGFPNLPPQYGGWKLVAGPGGQELAVVGGYNAQKQYSGFEVGGGAPVYAQNPGGQFQLGLPGSALQPGATFAVPTQYLRNVQTSKPVTNAPSF